MQKSIGSLATDPERNLNRTESHFPLQLQDFNDNDKIVFTFKILLLAFFTAVKINCRKIYESRILYNINNVIILKQNWREYVLFRNDFWFVITILINSFIMLGQNIYVVFFHTTETSSQKT